MSDLLVVSPPKGELPAAMAAQPQSVVVRLLARIPGLRGGLLSEQVQIAVHGSIWTLAGYGLSQLLKLASTLILARLLLNPTAFGLMALINVFLGGLEVLSDLGIGLDIVQHPRGEDLFFLDTAFLLQMLRSIMLCGIAMALAVPFASFYHQRAIEDLAIIGSLSIGIRGFASTSVWLMRRRVQLGKLTAVNISSDAAGLVISVVWALISPTAWALVGGKVATAVAYVIASHLFSDRRPHLRIQRSAARDILAYGTGIFVSSVTYFIATESERLVVGKFASVAELGCFSLALSMSYAPFGIMQRVISNVFFPMISSAARDNSPRIASKFRKFRVAFLIASVAMGVGFITLGPTVVRLVLRPQYADTAWMLQLLGFRSALELFGSAAGAMLLAVGTTRYTAIGNMAKIAFLAVGLAVSFSRYGLHQALWVLALAPAVHYAVVLWGLRKTVRGVLRSELGYFAGFVGASLATVLAYSLLLR